MPHGVAVVRVTVRRIRDGLSWYGIVGIVRCGAVPYGVLCCEVGWYGMVWHGMAWCAVQGQGQRQGQDQLKTVQHNKVTFH